MSVTHSAASPDGLEDASDERAEYRRALEALQESEDRFRSFMDHTPALAWLKDEHGRYVYANRMWEQSVKLSPGEWLHLTDDSIHPPEMVLQCRDGDHAVLTSGKVYESLETSKDDAGKIHYWWVLKYPFQDRKGVRYVGGIALDVTKRSEAERSLKDSEQRYHALYDDNPTMFFTLSIDGTVLSVNRYGAGQLGYAQQDLIGHSILDVFHPEDHAQVHEQLAACRTNVTRTITWELRKVRKDRTTLWVREFARAVPDPKGRLVILIVCEDITERKLAERALRRAHVRMQAIQAERERLAHDLHDNIIQRLYAIGMGLEDGRYRIQEKGESSISTLLNHSIEELNLVIEDVRNFIGGKDTLLQLSPASTAARFRKLARKHRNGSGPAIDVRIDDGAAEHLSELQRKHLYLIAQEAVNNMLRHSQAAKASLHLCAEPHGIVMTVQDNGIGFDPTAPMISRFGLKTMRARAKKIGARFKLQSHRHKGTTVTVELPTATGRE
ncbi:MAG: PAS domain S-box protein [Nitrospiraceae bacterium]